MGRKSKEQLKKEKWNKYQREYAKKRYHEDPEFRLRRISSVKKYQKKIKKNG